MSIFSKPAGNTYVDQPDWLPSYEKLIRASGDAGTRKLFNAALAKYDELQALRKKLHQPMHAEAAYNELKKLGVVVADDLVRLAVVEFRESHRDQLQEATYIPIIAQLDAAVNPEIKRLCNRIADGIEKDLETLNDAEQAIAKRFDAPPIRSQLHAGLEAAVSWFRARGDKGAECFRHYMPRTLLSDWFSADNPL